ncbi:MAG: glycoside hydrolase family 38 C-terminal domain-containing protein [Candidatus Melainabacteria bacterium]|nr:glycoside hydrolase family 38 C-terminal domain-containing protein [Candidatus Melainabacteria bacterium]
MAQDHQILLYLHTHWDREWYWSFGAYRTQLAQVVESIVQMLEKGELDNFMLDGQTCLLEDLAEMAPSLTARITSLVQKRSLSVGPWYVLADQLLVSGESLTRNLHYGMKAARQLGAREEQSTEDAKAYKVSPLTEPALVGYCPDTFGHSADLPRILQGFGIDNAVVWRGVPEMTAGPFFLWQSPDGSEVLATHLARGYYQTAFHENVGTEKLADYLLSFLGWQKNSVSWETSNELIETNNKALTYSDELRSALVPVGGDHLRPAPNFKDQLRDALALINSKSPVDPLATLLFENNFSAEAVSLETLFNQANSALRADLSALQLVRGELRDNRMAFECERAYMLAGVLSTRLYLKRENRLMEHAILKKVEPIRTMMALANWLKYPHEELDHSWRLLLKNHPHDSICGCSIDEVHDEMQSRSKSLAAQLNVITRQAQEALTRYLVPAESEIRLGLQYIDVLDPQQVNRGEGPSTIVINSATNPVSMPVLIRFAKGKETALTTSNKQLSSDSLQIVSRKDASEAFLELSGVPQFKNVEIIEAYAYADSIPAFGLAKLPGLSATISAKSETAANLKENYTSAMNNLAIHNQFLIAYIDKKGQLIVKEKKSGDASGVISHKLGHNFIDTADGGDTYNYDPLALDQPITSEIVDVRPGMCGPITTSLIVEYQITLPVGLKETGVLKRKGEAIEAPALVELKRSSKTIKHKIITEIILKANVPIVYFETDFENKATDHRLEVIFSTGAPLSQTISENHYSLITRPVSAKATLHPIYSEKACISLGHEGALDRYPCQRFFIAHNQVFFNVGLPEYGAAGSEVTITLLRAVSYLSRNRLRTRGGGAGPNIATPGANSLGLNHVSYAWAPIAESEPNKSAAAYGLAEIYENPLTAFVVPDNEFDRMSFVEIENHSIKIMASYIDEDNKMTLRLLNVAETKQTSKILGSQDATIHKLDGTLTKLAKAAGIVWGRPAVELEFQPFELITVKIANIEPSKS